MSRLSKLLRKLMTFRTVGVEKTVIVWWGIFPWGATIGDYYAVTNLSAELTRRGLRHSIISHPDYGFEGHTSAANLSRIKRTIKTIVFVCGPLTGNRTLTQFLLDHPQARRLAVAVSVLKNHEETNRLFEEILARDGRDEQYFDLAINKTIAPTSPARNRRAVIGLCLRKNQSDYGKGVAQFEKAEHLLRRAISQIEADVVEIDTVIRGDNRVAAIEAKFASIDVMATTRMHGAIFALGAGKPVLALDQIPGGAKVMAALEQVQWPHVVNVEHVTEAEIVAGLRSLMDDFPVDSIRHSQAKILELGARTLARAGDLIEEISPMPVAS